MKKWIGLYVAIAVFTNGKLTQVSLGTLRSYTEPIFFLGKKVPFLRKRIYTTGLTKFSWWQVRRFRYCPPRHNFAINA